MTARRCAILLAALAGSHASRLEDAGGSSDVSNNKTSEDLCGSWLIVTYSDGTQSESATFGSYRYLENQWKSQELFSKTKSNGCVLRYVAECATGAFKVTKQCPGKVDVEESRCLGGSSCVGSWGSGRKVVLFKGESLTLTKGGVVLGSGKVVVHTVDPSKGIALQDAPGDENSNTELGCYCCKTSWGLQNPFSQSSGRLAWRRGKDNNMECMLAWKISGDGLSDYDAQTSALGVLARIPEFMMTAADMMTGTIGRHIACAATCPLRKPEFEENQYAFTKLQTDLDKD